MYKVIFVMDDGKEKSFILKMDDEGLVKEWSQKQIKYWNKDLAEPLIEKMEDVDKDKE